MPGRGRPPKNPVPAPQKLLTEAATLNPSVSQSHVLFFIECSDGGISSKQVDTVEALLKGKKGENLFLVLHTYGGDVYSAVRIMRIIQDKFKEIKVIVPDFVYSSGTIMALGGNEIYMDVDASIGPLDKPMENPRDGSSISSLDITETLTNLASTAESIAGKFYAGLRGPKIRLSKIEAAKLAYETSVDIINPMLGKIDPYFLQSGYRQTKIGLNYAIDMLTTRMMSNKIRQAIITSRTLVNEYPSHGYGIYRDEARYYLNLKVENLESLSVWPKIEPRFDLLKKRTQAVEYVVI